MRPVSTFFDIQLSNSRGRLGKYKYYDMHHVVEEALNCVRKELGCNF